MAFKEVCQVKRVLWLCICIYTYIYIYMKKFEAIQIRVWVLIFLRVYMVSLLCNLCHAFPVKVDCHFWWAGPVYWQALPLKAAFRPDDEGTEVPLERDARRSSMIGTRFFKEHTHASHVKYVFENGKYNNSCLTST